MSRRPRLLSVLAILIGGALALISSTQTWLDVTLRDVSVAPLPVAGAVAVPLLAPLSLAALALGLALSIAGPVLRYIFGALALAIGSALTASASTIVAAPPVSAVASTVTDATGLAGAESVSAVIDTISATPWPALTVAAALVIAAGGVLTLATAHRWPGAGRRFRTGPDSAVGSRPHDAIDSWDDLSRGDDPTV